MEAWEISALVEFSEAAAYSSLVSEASRFCAEHGFSACRLGLAQVLVAPAVRNTLNLNRVIALGVGEPASEAALERVAGIYQEHGLSYAIEVAPGAQPAELVAWLRARRMRRSVPTAMHYRALDTPLPADASTVSVVRANSEQYEQVAEICCSVFRMPAAARCLLAAAGSVSGWRHWLAYHGKTPIAAALSYVADGVAWLGWDATLPEYRGHRAQRALIAARIDDAAAAGCHHATTETALHAGARQDPSYRNYAAMGFVFAYERSTYVRAHSLAPVPDATP